jgi:hypothetical protein
MHKSTTYTGCEPLLQGQENSTGMRTVGGVRLLLVQLLHSIRRAFHRCPVALAADVLRVFIQTVRAYSCCPWPETRSTHILDTDAQCE